MGILLVRPHLLRELSGRNFSGRVVHILHVVERRDGFPQLVTSGGQT